MCCHSIEKIKSNNSSKCVIEKLIAYEFHFETKNSREKSLKQENPHGQNHY